MPLSEEENRLLEQMEQALAAEDPKFVSTLRGRTLERTARTRALLAGVAFLAGVAVLLGGAMAQLTWLGIVGFLIMLASATLGLAAWRGRRSAGSTPPSSYDDSPQGRAARANHPSQYGERSPSFGVIDGGRPARRRSHRGHKPKQRGHFMSRVEQRWEQRRRRGY